MTTLPNARSRWLIYACRTTYVAEVAEIIWRTGGSIAALVDNLPDPVASGLAPVLAPDELTEAARKLPALIPLITPGHRHAVATEARRRGLGIFPSLADPSAVVASTARLGEGTIVNALAVVGAEAELGRFVHLNRAAAVGHHVRIADYVTLGPGAVVAGQAVLETGCFIGAGACVAPGVRIGANSVVGVGAVVLADVASQVTVLGNPARVVRPRTLGYGDVSVPVDAPAEAAA